MTKQVLVQWHDDDGEVEVFCNNEQVWRIDPPPRGKLTRGTVTRIMGLLRYVPVSRWDLTDWGAERKFCVRV